VHHGDPRGRSAAAEAWSLSVSLTMRPLTVKAAIAFVREHHRHNRPPLSALFALGAHCDGQLVGVVMVGRPIARMMQDGHTAEVTRCCVLEGAPMGTCSFLYARARRAAAALGYDRVLTYTLASETGASLRGAGWQPVAKVRARQWSTPKRLRESQPIHGLPKVRWQTPP
jgi:hypothetical protein